MLLNCSECSGKVSSQAASCPSCGFPVASMRGELPKEVRTARPSASVPRAIDAPLLKKAGVLVTYSLVELRGRSFSVLQLNSLKLDQIAHPRALGLRIVATFGLLVGGAILWLDLIITSFMDARSNAYDMSAICGVIGMILVVVGIVAVRALRRLPKWALLRLEMSSGSVKALDAETTEVETVAAAIRAAMASR